MGESGHTRGEVRFEFDIPPPPAAFFLDHDQTIAALIVCITQLAIDAFIPPFVHKHEYFTETTFDDYNFFYIHT
jgi:hypothetical protein